MLTEQQNRSDVLTKIRDAIVDCSSVLYYRTGNYDRAYRLLRLHLRLMEEIVMNDGVVPEIPIKGGFSARWFQENYPGWLCQDDYILFKLSREIKS